MTFDETAIEPDQQFELCNDQYGVHEYPVKYESIYVHKRRPFLPHSPKTVPRSEEE